MGKVALFGAAGAIGRSVAQALSAAGRPYRLVGRRREPLLGMAAGDPLAEVATWDPADPVSVRKAAEGIDAIIYLVGVPYHQFAQHPAVLAKTLEGAVAAGVEKILLVGTVYPYGRARTQRVDESHPREPHTFKGKMRKAQEDLLLEAHAAGRIKAAILRVPDFYGPGVESSFIHGIFKSAATGTRAMMVGPIDRPHEFAYVPDVAEVLVRLLDKDEAFGRAWNMGTAGATTQREVARQAYELAGRKPKTLAIGKLGIRLMGFSDPFMRELVEMHYLMTEPVLLDDSALQLLLGGYRKTPYAEGIGACLAACRSA